MNALPVVAIALAVAMPSTAAELSSQAVVIWNGHTKFLRDQAGQRARSSRALVWLAGSADQMRQFREGKVVTEAMAPGGMTAAADALIHEWAAAVFLPGVTTDRVLEVLDRYEQYPEFYKPTVVQATLVHREPNKDRLLMRWRKKTALASTSIEGDCEVTYQRISPARWLSESLTTRVQEVDNLGRADERLLPAGTGTGYVWRLYTATATTAVSDGVIVELRGALLSRDVPAAIEWLVNPFVRRLARSVLTSMLEQTAAAVTRCDGVSRAGS